MPENPKFTTKDIRFDPELAQERANLRIEIKRLITEASASLPKGIIKPVGDIPQYLQKDVSGCFYACLVAARTALKHDHTDELAVTAEAKARDLMSPQGAFTQRLNQERQADFVQEQLGLNVRFINFAQEGATAVVEQVAAGHPVLFGYPHWVLLYGIDNRQGEPTQLKWITMNPMSDRTTYTPYEDVLERLDFYTGLETPIVVVEGADDLSHMATQKPENTQLPASRKITFRKVEQTDAPEQPHTEKQFTKRRIVHQEDTPSGNPKIKIRNRTDNPIIFRRKNTDTAEPEKPVFKRKETKPFIKFRKPEK